jgi:hypothetical protein
MRTIVRLSPLVAMVGVIALAVGILESGAFHKGVEEAGCHACHTMHGSQDGFYVEPSSNLIAIAGDGCLACHDGTFGPDVYDVSPELELPGGDYSNANNSYYNGHNPASGSTTILPDLILDTTPPGGEGPLDNWSCNSCHDTLGGFDFRLLRKNPGDRRVINNFIADSDDESDIWEDGFNNIAQNESNHNVYKTEVIGADYGFGSWCAACHPNFQLEHAGNFPRHPTATPLSFKELNVYGTNHNYLYPLETMNSNAGPTFEWTLIEGQEGVTCLTCHKAHASQYSDALRWDHEGGSTEGCDKCHANP